MSPHILILDDDKDIAEAMKILLEELGFEVEVLFDAHNAITNIRAKKPNLIFMDVLMSGVDGRDVCRQIKSDETLATIPVVMVSAHPSAKSTLAKYKADDFLMKPFSLDELQDLTAKYIR